MPVSCLVVGGGGREHALVRCLAASPEVERVYCAPGNPGITAEAKARLVPCAADDLPGLVAFARAQGVSLTVVGPEAPLVLGLVDAFHAAGLTILGPSAAAAALEGSKDFTKRILAEAGVPTAASTTHRDLATALAALPDGPIVVKADGLAAGKGVVVADTRGEAEAALRSFLGAGDLGEAGRTVLLEERLVGEEVSVIALCDGVRALCFPPAQDHKRLGTGDVGPNTGGMGAYAPAPALDATALDAVRTEVLEPVLRTMAARGTPFRGFLFAGLMLTPSGPRVLEFNVRFGDPEAQVLLALLDTEAASPYAAFLAAAEGRLTADALRFLPGAAVCVVVAAEGYPGTPRRGVRLPPLDPMPTGVRVLHAGTALDDAGHLVTHGGRVLGVTSEAPTLRAALDACYAGVERVLWPGAQYRTDIGARALARAP
jgi:phosphoribosylamine--glycine ligase